MKALKSTFIFSLLALLGITLLFSTCKKDTECTAVITVKMQNDTLVYVPFATVKIHKSDVYEEGVTNTQGQISKTFKLEAILEVDAVFITVPPDTLTLADTLYGKTVVRLVPGKTVNKTVFIN